jgi:hypothetical protein
MDQGAGCLGLGSVLGQGVFLSFVQQGACEMVSTWLIWGGAALTLAGIGLLVWCVLRVLAARRAGLDDQEMRARMQKAVTLNLLALFVSCIGLMMVILGIFLG